MTSSRLAFALFLLGIASACGRDPDAAADRTTDTVDARDRAEAVARSGLPGAAGVDGALGIADSAAARAARLDSAARP